MVGGADHFGTPCDRPHIHLPVARYLFKPNERGEVADSAGPHAHVDYRTEDGLFAHLEGEHGRYGVVRRNGVRSVRADGRRAAEAGRWFSFLHEEGYGPEEFALDQMHEHYTTVDLTSYAKRLSSHPMGFERIKVTDRVCFALEGCLKEAALVSAGEATFSCPSVSLWDAGRWDDEDEPFARELERFARDHLVDKAVLVICDSDWEREDDDSVIRQALMARDTLRRYGVRDAHVAAPPHPRNVGCMDHDKHGVDDHLGPCTKGSVDELVWVDREVRQTFSSWIEANGVRSPSGRALRRPTLELDEKILTWIATHAAQDGTSRVAMRSVAKALLPEIEEHYGRRVDLESAVKDVWPNSVRDRLILRYGVVEETEPLRLRRGKHLRRVETDWRGELRVAEELRAESIRGRTVGDLMLRR